MVFLLFVMVVSSVFAENSTNTPEQISEWETKAESGDAEAQYHIGKAFYGDGIEKDLNKAFTWFEKSVKDRDMQTEKAHWAIPIAME